VAESCNFCAHLVDSGELPACVRACQEEGGGALCFGNLDDPDSEIARLLTSRSATRLREDFGTEPKVYYVGL
jgi:molybdopterin-containing oxidoreductase family iron-sulfur binding subunit